MVPRRKRDAAKPRLPIPSPSCDEDLLDQVNGGILLPFRDTGEPLPFRDGWKWQGVFTTDHGLVTASGMVEANGSRLNILHMLAEPTWPPEYTGPRGGNMGPLEVIEGQLDDYARKQGFESIKLTNQNDRFGDDARVRQLGPAVVAESPAVVEAPARAPSLPGDDFIARLNEPVVRPAPYTAPVLPEPATPRALGPLGAAAGMGLMGVAAYELGPSVISAVDDRVSDALRDGSISQGTANAIRNTGETAGSMLAAASPIAGWTTEAAKYMGASDRMANYVGIGVDVLARVNPITGPVYNAASLVSGGLAGLEKAYEIYNRPADEPVQQQVQSDSWQPSTDLPAPDYSSTPPVIDTSGAIPLSDAETAANRAGLAQEEAPLQYEPSPTQEPAATPDPPPAAYSEP